MRSYVLETTPSGIQSHQQALKSETRGIINTDSLDHLTRTLSFASESICKFSGGSNFGGACSLELRSEQSLWVGMKMFSIL